MATLTGSLQPEELTRKSYEELAQEWARRNYHAGLCADGHAALSLALPDGSLLEIGCGSGTDSGPLSRRYHPYVGTDFVVNMIKEAKKAQPGLDFRVMNVYHLRRHFPKRRFDGFWCAACLLHLERKNTPLALRQIRSVIRTGGYGFISLKEGDGEEVWVETSADGSEWVRQFTLWRIPEFSAVLEQSGFRVDQAWHYSDTEHTESDVPVPWIKFIVQAV